MHALTRNDRHLKALAIICFLAVIYFYALMIDRSLNIDATNCGCSYPGCGCLQITLVPYDNEQDLPDWQPLEVPTVPPAGPQAPTITKQPLP